MLYVDDLHLESDILPLFNYTHNTEAEAVVNTLLREPPPTLELVLERQAILQGFLVHWEFLADFNYSKIQFQEVRAFLNGICSGQIAVETNQAKAAIRLFLSEEARYHMRARYVQLVQFLHRLQQHYLLRINPQRFSSGFRPQLRTLGQFLERFGLDDTALAIHEDAFTVAHMIRLARQLQAIREVELHNFWRAFHLFEAYWSVAKGIHDHNFVFPSFADDGLQLAAFYHPKLQQPVTNTLSLTAEQPVMVLTGPNMAGKSTLLKAVGLCVYLAHAGFGVPAARCQLPFYQTILIAINSRDSLRDGYSHFMTELQNLKAALHAAHNQGRTFAIFDELFRGTNVDDALQITRTTLAGLTQFPGCHFLISTHLLQLQSQLPTTTGLCSYQIECVLQNGLPVFSYRLQPGWSTLKIGQLLFETEGLNALLNPVKP